MNLVKRGLDGFQLKLLALLVMTLDHIHYFAPGGSAPYWLTLAGRLAAPIFLFLCAEGFFYTRSKPKYLVRMYAFSVLMKLATMLLCSAFPRPDNATIANDMFSTMFLVGWCIMGIELLRERGAGRRRLIGALMLFGMLAATVLLMAVLLRPESFGRWLQPLFLLLPTPLTCEGSVLWVLLGVGFYYLRRTRWKAALLLAAFCLLNLGLIPVTLDSALYIGCTAAAAIPICLYNGKPGKHRCKWLFYFYYPAHVYVLYMIRWWMMRG